MDEEKEEIRKSLSFMSEEVTKQQIKPVKLMEELDWRPNTKHMQRLRQSQTTQHMNYSPSWTNISLAILQMCKGTKQDCYVSTP